LWAYQGQPQTIIPPLQLYAASPLVNQAPVVDAGPNLAVTFPNPASLAGTSTDDGLPLGSVMTTTWSQVSGSGTVTFANASSPTTTVTFPGTDTYVLRLTATDTSLTAADEVSVTVNPPLPPSTNGLTGQYFNDPGTGSHFVTPVLTRIDTTVNFGWAAAAPAAGVKTDDFAVRWTGQVQAPVSGTYRFRTISDDGIRLWVNGQQIINNWTDHSATTNTSAAVSLAAGVKYTIVLEYYEHTGQATARLQWSYPGQSSYVVIPQTRLFP
jgi:hypothetical protein